MICRTWKDWDAEDKERRAKRDKQIERGQRIIELAREEYDIWYYDIHQPRKPKHSRSEELRRT